MSDDPTPGGKDLREMLRNNPEFRQLKVPYRIKYGSTVRAVDMESMAAFEDCPPLKRPLVMGERVAATGLCGDVRVGTVIQIAEDGKSAVADDGPCWLFLVFDKDADHEWTMHTMADKRAMSAWGRK